jgi:hypothetical protein
MAGTGRPLSQRARFNLYPLDAENVIPEIRAGHFVDLVRTKLLH